MHIPSGLSKSLELHALDKVCVYGGSCMQPEVGRPRKPRRPRMRSACIHHGNRTCICRCGDGLFEVHCNPMHIYTG